jgi:chromosomal replication initiation ATPase DnaA
MNIYNSELIRQNEAHKLARANLGFAPASSINVGSRINQRQLALEAENAELRSKVEKLEASLAAISTSRKAKLAEELSVRRAEVSRLQLDLSDAHARMISQADVISTLLAAVSESGDEETQAKRPVAAIVADVLRDFPGITWEDMKGVRRERRLSRPRQICMFEIYEQRKDLSFPKIGKMFGGRDHTTVLHAVNKVRAEREAAR